jgi:hypothetical protein
MASQDMFSSSELAQAAYAHLVVGETLSQENQGALAVQ